MRGFVLVALCLLASFAAADTTSTYYLLDGDARQGHYVDGSTRTDFSLIAGDGSVTYALAVADTIRINARDAGLAPGHEYTLAGVSTGNSYPFAAGGTGQHLDGTTDGVNYNYSVEWNGEQSVWQYDRLWANPTRLFRNVEQMIGITYDPNGSLWISIDDGNIQNVDMAGNVISQFDPGNGRWGALAYEYSTNTLWAHLNGSDTLRQWALDGTFLGDTNVAGLSDNIWGGEFANVPEPASLALLGFGLLALRRRRRKTA